MPMNAEQQALFDQYKAHDFFKNDLGSLEHIVTISPLCDQLHSIMEDASVTAYLSQNHFLKAQDLLTFGERFVELCSLFLNPRVQLALDSDISRETLSNPHETLQIARDLASQHETHLSQTAQGYGYSFAFGLDAPGYAASPAVSQALSQAPEGSLELPDPTAF
ncbi:MAG: hypothetical protein K0R66_1605 [Gammaproteobacteria bacterium]|jgi:hypothetical protein|nr:hypothetical protein [Gammaproteobacteria bacterium]